MKYATYRINLAIIEELREFFKAALSKEEITRSLVISGRDNSNLRLWALREKLGKSCEEFANILGVDIVEYKKYEFQGNKIPDEVIEKVCKKFSISKEWLKCKVPFFPFPIKKK